ncbi:Uncharacterized protein dnm_031490 [Desulfonema magnum]|uniref:Uncharacterized protein n=1 Tax=Desulfonema magnum TaxID=45655 RepID=A0A975BKE1_9BACT|nr:Uncharacterized protein dnm_031490 [Desulfonema magnum]
MVIHVWLRKNHAERYWKKNAFPDFVSISNGEIKRNSD